MEAFNFPFAYTFTTSTSSSNSSSSSNNPFAFSTTPVGTTSPWMDCRIWSRLPQRLLDRIIAFLPPPAFFRARCVCKRWYSLLFSNNFLELYFQASSSRRHWFLFFKHKSFKSYIYRNTSTGSSITTSNITTPHFEGYLFDPYDVVWYRIPFPLIPSGFSPVASSGGLVCWVSDGAGIKTLILCNPLTGSVSQLPPTSRPRLFPSIGLKVGHSSIDVSVAGDDLISPYAVKNLSTESFHIDAGGFYSIWGTTSTLPRLCSLESGQMVCVGGKFYCMNYSPFSVLAYDLASNAWLKIQAPMKRFLRSPTLVESGGKLVLVAAVEKSKLNVPKSLRLWSLQQDSGSWEEIGRMHPQLYEEFAQIEAGRGFDCVGHGEFIAMVIRGSDHKALMFDISQKVWQWIPPCPFIHHNNINDNINVHGTGDQDKGNGVLHGFAYEPRLATPVTTLLDQLTIPFQAFNA